MPNFHKLASTGKMFLENEPYEFLIYGDRSAPD